MDGGWLLVPFIALLALSNAQTNKVYVYNLTYSLSMDPVDYYETIQLVSALQGLVNRNSSTFYIILTDMDSPWWEYMETQNYVNSANVENITSVGEMLSIFSSFYSGVVLYDPNVPSTSNVAATASGARDLLPFSYRPVSGSLYSKFVAGGPQLPVKLSLVGLFNGDVTGSAKCDAYMWAIKEFLLSGESDASIMGYYIDYWWVQTAQPQPYLSNTASNHDYFVAHKAFFWDLDIWGDQVPNDDPTQPVGTDLKTLTAIMQAASSILNGTKMTHIGGFTPWNWKYVNDQHQGVATEWQTAQLLSTYNAYLDADACCVNGFANAAFYSHFPLQEHYVQNPKPTLAQLQEKGYVDANGNVVPRGYIMFYIGDYDSAAWIYSMFKNNWDDPAGSAGVPLGWALDPNLSERFPLAFEYANSQKTADDFFITGDSGAGYLNPSGLIAPRSSGLPDAQQLWIKHNVAYYRKFDISFTGFLINGNDGAMTTEGEEMYTSFSWDGMVDPGGYNTPFHLTGNTPCIVQTDLPQSNLNQSVQAIISQAKSASIDFHMWRSVLQPRGFYKQLSAMLQEAAGDSVAIVDPYTIGYLARLYLGGNNNNRVTYVSDTFGRTVAAGSKHQVNVTVRNDGWNILNHSDVTLNVWWVVDGKQQSIALLADDDIASGDSGVFEGTFTAPSSPLAVTVNYGLFTSSGTSFESLGNLAYEFLLYITN